MQAAGEYHATNLRGESAGTHRSQESASLPARASLLTPRSPLWTQSRADSDPGGLRCGLRACISNKLQVMWAGAGAGTTLTTTSQEWYFSHLNVHGLPGDAVGSSPAAWVRACTSKQASRPHCSSVVPVLLRRRPDSIRPDSIRGSDIAAEAAFLQEGLSTSSCSQVLEQRPGCGVNSLADVQERKPRIRVKGPGQSPAHPVSRLRTSPGPREPALPAGRSVLPTSWPRLGSAGRSPSTSHLPTSKCRGRGSLFICLRPPFTQGCTEDEEGRV